MTLIRNEQTKLTATFLNGIGIAVFAVGGLAPVFSSLYSEGGPTNFLLAMSVVCFFASLGLHWLARTILRRLEP
ncbi:MAG: amino acid transporter [Alphaproteobacteria bacterium]|nr:amino acid transporter [Alphaproteobacteria bacterium]